MATSQLVYLTICYGHPSAGGTFDDHYRTVHRGLAEKMPGLKDFRLGSCIALGDETARAPYHLMAQLGFDDLDHLHAAMASPDGRAAAEDLKTFADGGVTIFVQQAVP